MGEAAGPGRAAAERRFRFELAAHPGSPAQARRLARARLTGWSVCEDTCDTAALVISELVTNAIVHTASGTVVCELRDGGDLVRIAVRDEGCAPGEPHPSPQRPEEEHGRGLFLVDALCQAWGAQEYGPGLLVWADLARGGEVARGHAESEDGLAVSLADLSEPCDDLTASDPGLTPSHDGPTTSRDGLAASRAGLVAQRGGRAVSHDGLTAPRDDLGWGSPPKPGPAGGSDDEDDDADHAHHADQAHRGAETQGPAHGPAARAHHAPGSGGPLPRVGPQRHRGPQTGVPATPAEAGRAPDTHGETPARRPRPGTVRDLDRDSA